MKLNRFLIKKNYIAIKLKYTKTNHYQIKAKINGKKGVFILDTGASNTCIGSEFVDKFKLITSQTELKAIGAGSTDITTEISDNNIIKMGKWKKRNNSLVIIDVSHINAALVSHNSKPIDGIIGADILKKGKAIVAYSSNLLYLKKEYFEY